jgi:hypothetical protein
MSYPGVNVCCAVEIESTVWHLPPDAEIREDHPVGVLKKSRDTTCMVRSRSGGRSFDIMVMPFIPYVSNFSLF